MTNCLFSIQQLFDRTMIFDLQRQIDENNIDIILLKNKIIELNKSNQIFQLFIKKLLSRYFSDYIIKILIKKYPKKFSPINITSSNMYEIISNYRLKMINEDKLESITNLIINFNSQENNINK